MKHLALHIVGWLAFFYLLLFIPSFIIEETRVLTGSQTVYIDRDFNKSIYANTLHYAAYGIDQLDSYPDQVFLIGASNAAEAFDPDRIKTQLPGYKVHNLSIDGANITEMAQVVDVILSKVDVRQLHSAVFVLNLHFVSFLDNQRLYGSPQNSIDREKLRHHLYKLQDGAVVPVLPQSAMQVAVFLIRPFIWFYKLENNIKKGCTGVNMTPRSAILPNDAAAQTFFLIARQNESQGRPGDPAQYDALRHMIGKLQAIGATVIAVDMPVASYIRSHLPAYEDYHGRIGPVIAQTGIAYYDMAALIPDGQFMDDSHPKAEFYNVWSDRLAGYLKTVILPARK